MQKKSILLAAGMLAIGALAIAPASAATMTFREGVSPTAGYNVHDAFVRSDQPTTVQSSIAQDLLVGKNGTALFRTLFGFDLTALKNVVVPVGQELQIDAVTLTLSHGIGPGSTVGGTGNSIDLTLTTYGSSFNEASATWNSPGNSPGSETALSTTGTFDPTPVAPSPASAPPPTAVFGTTNAFESEIVDVLSAASPFFYGIVYSPGAEAGSTNSFARIFSSERNYNVSPQFYGSSVRPALTVEYSFVAIPEPVGLSAVMALGALLIRRRQTTKA